MHRAHLLGRVDLPNWLGGGEVNGSSLRLDQFSQARHITRFAGTKVAPTVDRGLQVHQAAVQTGLFHRGRQIADEGGTCAAFGDRAFRRVVGGVQVEVRQVVYQAVRPAAAGHPSLFARHEFK